MNLLERVKQLSSVLSKLALLEPLIGVSWQYGFAKLCNFELNPRPALLLGLFAEGFSSRGSGTIVNLASMYGKRAVPNRSAYVASKFAVLGFSQSLRTEMEPHKIGVTAISAPATALDPRM